MTGPNVKKLWPIKCRYLLWIQHHHGFSISFDMNQCLQSIYSILIWLILTIFVVINLIIHSFICNSNKLGISTWNLAALVVFVYLLLYLWRWSWLPVHMKLYSMALFSPTKRSDSFLRFTLCSLTVIRVVWTQSLFYHAGKSPCSDAHGLTCYNSWIILSGLKCFLSSRVTINITFHFNLLGTDILVSSFL